MKKPYQLLLALGVAAASLSSCSRANYAFNPNTPAYRGSVSATATSVEASKPVTAPATTIASTPVVTTIAQPAASSVSVADAPARIRKPKASAKLTLAQRVVANKIAKQIAKASNQKQNAAEVAQPASKLGRSALVAGVGLLLLLLGGAAEVGIIAVIGLIAFIVGIVLLVIALVNGE